MVSCAIKGCKSRSDILGKIGDISFHRIPLDKVIRDKWMKLLDPLIQDSLISLHKTARICSKHFSPSHFKSNGKSKALIKTALPNQNLPFIKRRNAERNTSTSSKHTIPQDSQDHNSNRINSTENNVATNSQHIAEKSDTQEDIKLINKDAGETDTFKTDDFNNATLTTAENNLYDDQNAMCMCKIDTIFIEEPESEGLSENIKRDAEISEDFLNLDNVSQIKTSTPLEATLKNQLEIAKIICKKKDAKIQCLQLQKKRMKNKIKYLEQQLKTHYPIEQDIVILNVMPS